MNVSKFLVPSLFTAVLAFAQFPWEAQGSAEGQASSSSSSEEISTPPSVAPTPVVSSPPKEKPVAPEGKTVFDNLRGNAYNPYSTQGAASTVGDLVTLPSDIYGKKFFYVSPVNFLGYTAFDLGGGSTLLGLDNSVAGNTAALILGYATPAFGVALNYSISKIWTSDKEPVKISERVTNPGDNIGLYFSAPLGFATLYANGGWLTYGESRTSEVDGDETSTDYSEITFNAGLTGESGSLNYDLFLSFIRTGGSQTLPNGNKLVDESTFTGLGLGLNLGYAALQSSNARVLVGLNNFLYMQFYDERKPPSGTSIKSDNVIGFIMYPNILGELALSESLLAFTGASHGLSLLGGNNDKDKNTTYFHIRHSNGTAAFAGLRYQKTNWALEAQVATNVFNNPFGGFNGSNIFTGFGGFIYF